MKPSFDERKATQLAAKLLSLRGGSMTYLKLIKLMYLVDREALIRWGRSVTFDHYVSMRNGPVLSTTLDLVTEEAVPWIASYWRTFISEPSNWRVRLIQDCPTDDLSDAEERLVESVFQEYGRMNRWKLVRLLHETLPEWKDPGQSSIPISYDEILEAGRLSEEDVEEITREIEGLAFMDKLMSGARVPA